MHAIIEAAGEEVLVILPNARVALFLRIDTHMVVRMQQRLACLWQHVRSMAAWGSQPLWIARGAASRSRAGVQTSRTASICACLGCERPRSSAQETVVRGMAKAWIGVRMKAGK